MPPPYTSIMMSGVGSLHKSPPASYPPDLVFMTTWANDSDGTTMADSVPDYNPLGASLSGNYIVRAGGYASGPGNWSGINIAPLPTSANIIRQIHVVFVGTSDWHTSRDQGWHWNTLRDDGGTNHENGYFNHYTSIYGHRTRGGSNVTSDNTAILYTSGQAGIGQMVWTFGDQHTNAMMYSGDDGADTGNAQSPLFVWQSGGTLSIAGATHGLNMYGKPSNVDDSLKIMSISIWDHPTADFKWTG